MTANALQPPQMDEHTVEHLKLISQVIERMGRNSFQIKTWTVVLIAAIFALAASASPVDYRYYLVGLLPSLIFWGLDGYFLRQERQFRALYDAVRRGEHDLQLYGLFSMNTRPYDSQVAPWGRVCVSRTIVWFYLPLVAVIGAISLITQVLTNGGNGGTGPPLG